MTKEKELLDVVLFLENFHLYILGAHVVLFIDHPVLKYLLIKKDSKTMTYQMHHTASRIQSRNLR